MIDLRVIYLILLCHAVLAPLSADEITPGTNEDTQILERRPVSDITGSIELGKFAMLSPRQSPAGGLTLIVETKGIRRNEISGHWALNESELIMPRTHVTRGEQFMAVMSHSRPAGLYYSGILLIEKNSKTGEWNAYRCLDSKALGETNNKRIWIEDIDFEGVKKNEVKLKVAKYVREGEDAGVVKREWIIRNLKDIEKKVILKQNVSVDEKGDSNGRGNEQNIDSENRELEPASE